MNGEGGTPHSTYNMDAEHGAPKATENVSAPFVWRNGEEVMESVDKFVSDVRESAKEEK